MEYGVIGLTILVIVGGLIYVFSSSGNSLEDEEFGDVEGTYEEYFTEASKLYRKDLYQLAERSYKIALVLAKRAKADIKATTKILSGLATSQLAQERYDEADSLFKEILAICESTYGAQDLGIITPLNHLVTLNTKQKKYTEAEYYSKKALTIQESNLGLDHMDVIKTLQQLADIYFEQQNYDEAEPTYKRLLAYHSSVAKPQQTVLTNIIQNLSTIYRETDRLSEAKELDARMFQLGLQGV